MAIAELVGPTIFTFTFAAFIAKDAAFVFPGAPFVLAAALMLISCVMGVVVTRGFVAEVAPEQPAPEISASP
jgi:DHA1 family tetracycline resistance protein-like MFS transporter